MKLIEEQRLISVKDQQGTLLKPVEATFAVEYKYKGEASAEVVMEGDVKRGVVMGDMNFPAASTEKELEYSEVKVNPKSAPFEFYTGKTRRFDMRIPQKDNEKEGVDMELEFTGNPNPTKEEIRQALSDAAEIKLNLRQSAKKAAQK